MQEPALVNTDDLGAACKLQPPVGLKDSEEASDLKESKTSERWRHFVDEVANQASVSLVSLLRNSVVLELTDNELVIGYQNIQVYTETKRSKVAEIARHFFNDTIKVIFKESDDGLDDSLQVKHDNAKAKKIEEIEAVAKDDPYALEIMKIFPNAEIQEITILDETEEGKN